MVAETWEGVLGLLIEVFRSRAGPMWMVQPANRSPHPTKMLDHTDILTINFSPLDHTQKMGPSFWKASMRIVIGKEQENVLVKIIGAAARLPWIRSQLHLPAVTMGKLLNLSVPHFPHLKNRKRQY